MGSCAGVQLAERPAFYQQFILQEKIGQGSYGKVYLAKDKRNDKVSAVKVQAAQFGREWVILDEVFVWRALGRHPNVVWFHDLRQEANVFFILMEVCPRALSDRVMSAPKWTATELMHDFQQALLGVQHMHSRRIVHRDIKVQNFLYGGSDGRTLKLADFGLSVEIHPGEKLEAVCGSPAFMAPEMVLRQGYDFKIDMWSMGVTFFMVMHGTLLVGKPKMSVSEMKEAIKSPTATKSSMMNAVMKAEAFTGEVKDLKMAALDVVRQLTVRDPLQRVGPEAALELQFLQLNTRSTWEQKLRFEQVLLVDRPAAKKKAVTEPGHVVAGKASQEKPKTDFSPVVPQAQQNEPDSLPDRGSGVPSPSGGTGTKMKSKSLLDANQSSVERRPSDRLVLPQELDSPRRAGAGTLPEGSTSSLKIQRYKSLGDMGGRAHRQAQLGAGSSELAPGLAESGDSIKLSVAACLMQAYRGGSRRLIDSGMPSLPGNSRGMLSPDNSYALGNFTESLGQPSGDDAVRRFAPAGASPGIMVGTIRSAGGPSGSSTAAPLNVTQLQLQAQGSSMRMDKASKAKSFANPGSSLKEAEEDPSAGLAARLPESKLPGALSEFQSPST